jgi:hypothetical protein
MVANNTGFRLIIEYDEDTDRHARDGALQRSSAPGDAGIESGIE